MRDVRITMIYEGTNGIQVRLSWKKINNAPGTVVTKFPKVQKFLSKIKIMRKYHHLLNLSRMLSMKSLLQQCG